MLGRIRRSAIALGPRLNKPMKRASLATRASVLTSRGQISKLVLIFAALVACAANSASAEVFYVRSKGNDSRTGTHPKTAFKTLQKALASATGNDIVYVGAGSYQGGLAKDYGNRPGSIRIFGDVGGAYTGDKGAVTIEVPPGRQGLQIKHAALIMVYNIDFVGTGNGTRGNGCHVQDISNYAFFQNCNFENLEYGIYSERANYNYAISCHYASTKYGDYIRGSAVAINYQSKYSGFSLGIQYLDVAVAYTYACSFQGSADKDGTLAVNQSIRAYRSGANVIQCTFDSSEYGIYGEDLTLLQVVGCQFNNPTSYAVYAKGRKLMARDIIVKGMGQQQGWGLMLADDDGAKSSLTNVSISGVYGGILAAGSDYIYQRVRLQGNQVGLYFDRQTPAMTIDEKSDLELVDNVYAIYASHQKDGFPGELTVQGQTIASNTHGIYAQETDLRLDSCHFLNNGDGVRVVNARQVSVNNCEFHDNVDRVDGGHYGLSISSERTTIRNLVAKNNDSGLLIENLGNQGPDLRNIQLADNEYMGLSVRNGTLTLTDKNGVTISGSRYGLYGYRTRMELTNVVMPTGCEYPLVNFEAELRLADINIVEGTIGIYSLRSPSISLTDVRIENQKQHGLYLYQPERVEMDDCQSSNNGSHGLFCVAPVGSPTALRVTNSTFSKNAYGFRTIGIPFDMAHASNLNIAGNVYGLRVEQERLSLTPEMNITLVDNRIAAMSFNGRMQVADVDISGNDFGLYTWQSKLQAKGTRLVNKTCGVVCYTGDSELNNVDIRDSVYGIYFSARDDQGDTLTIRDSKLENTTSVGIYVRTSGRTSKLRISDTQVIGGNYGVYGYQSELTVDRVTTTGSELYGIAQVYGTGTYEDLIIDGAGSWGFIAYGDSAVINRARIKSRYGVQLLTSSARVVNSLIQDSVYGVYTNNPDGNYEILQSTIGNISQYGLLHNAGQTVLTNSIVESDGIALWNRSSTGLLLHDHNLVFADGQSYVNELPGEHEIEKSPIFLDPQAGNFHLAEGSPAINAGIDLSAVTAVDIEGHARPSFRRFELGAYEYTQADGSLRVLDWEEKAH